MVLRRLRLSLSTFRCGNRPIFSDSGCCLTRYQAATPSFSAIAAGINRLSTSLTSAWSEDRPKPTSPRQTGKEELARFAWVI